MLAEHIHMLTERSKFSSRNILATYAVLGKQPRRSDCGKGGSGGGGVRGGGDGMIDGEWDNRGIYNGNHDFVVHNLNNIDKCWYPNPEYQKMNSLEKQRFYLNHKKQKKSSDWSERKAPTSVNAVYIAMSSQMSKTSISITSLATHDKNKDIRVKHLMSHDMTLTNCSIAVRESLRVKNATTAHLFVDS